MKMVKKYKWLIILPIVVLAIVFSFFYYFHQKDVKTFADFFASYEKFDKAISDFSVGDTTDLESKAYSALIEFDAKASTFRISSLVENDAELMRKAPDIVDLSKTELDILKSYKKAVDDKNADSDILAREFGDLTNKRQTAYAHFRQLAGLKD